MSDPTSPSASREKAATLRALHVPGTPLVLPNAWDAASARLVQEAGFSAVATSSVATSAVLGWADGEATPVEEVLGASARIARAVDVPVTVDFERGYRLPPAELVEHLTSIGVVGVNLEDSDPATGELDDADMQAGFLAAVRAAADAQGVDLVVNARTDSFIRGQGTYDEQVRASVDRGRRYLEAGADCVYPIATDDPKAIRALVEGIPGPVNIGFGSGRLTLAELAAFGVARVSFGPRLQRHLYARLASVMLPALAAGADPFAM
jgi:2-methylisocitrate lyase-like PEP mutase family enzyme